jgi:hypothetical protein
VFPPRQGNKHDPVGERAGDLGGNRKCQARLADAPGPDQGDEPATAAQDEIAHQCDLILAADKPRQLARQCGYRRRSAHMRPCRLGQHQPRQVPRRPLTARALYEQGPLGVRKRQRGCQSVSDRV